MKVWVVQGKYVDNHGWEDLEEIAEEEGGEDEAQRLVGEHQMAAPYGQHRVDVRDN